MKIARNILLALIATGALHAMPGAALAQDAVSPGPAQVELAGEVKVELRQMVDGIERTVLLDATEVVPGEVLVFTTRYRNATGATVDDFVITNPLPEAVSLAAAGDFEVSVDDGATYGALSAMTVTDAAGARRPAEPGDVTHLRWVLPQLAANATGTVEYRGIVR